MKVMVAVPVYGAVDPWFMRSLVGLMGSCDLEMALRLHPGDSLVCRARNILTADFLESDCTDLLFIDSDIVFTPADVGRICSHDLSGKERPQVIGGMYPLKQVGETQWCANALDVPQAVGESGLQRMKYVGTGFMRIPRRAFEMMQDHNDLRAYKPDAGVRETEWEFWSVGVHKPSGRYLSEDWFFCQRVLDLGGSVWLDTKVRLRHMGAVAYPLSVEG